MPTDLDEMADPSGETLADEPSTLGAMSGLWSHLIHPRVLQIDPTAQGAPLPSLPRPAPPSIVRPRPGALPGSQYFPNAIRNANPGIYQDPREIVKQVQVAPEHPALKELFGVTRDDLYNIGQQGTRAGNRPGIIASRANPRGSYTNAIMTPANARRMVDVLTEARKRPELFKGMTAWYVMDPAFQQLERLVGRDEAIRRYDRYNKITSMFSPGSDVETEINRGTAAHMMAERNKWPRFLKYGGVKEEERGRGFPKELRDVSGHPFHPTSQTKPVTNYLRTGEVNMTQPKVPLYMQASGVPETGFQTTLPIPDAHFTRSTGMPDVRTSKDFNVSMTTPEYAALGPWYRENVAAPSGLQAVPAQGLQWGAFAPQTGVDTAIGAPKLELLAKRIWERAHNGKWPTKTGNVDPYWLRDQVLLGREHAIWPMMMGAGLGGLVAAGSGAFGDMADEADKRRRSP
jgi:hypothetical protein